MTLTFKPETIKEIYTLLTRENPDLVILYTLKIDYTKFTFRSDKNYSIDKEKCRTGLVSSLNKISKTEKGPKFIYLGDIQDEASYDEVVNYSKIQWDQLCKISKEFPRKLLIRFTVDDYIYYLFNIDLSDLDYKLIYREHLKEVYNELSFETYIENLNDYYKDELDNVARFLAYFDLKKFILGFLINAYKEFVIEKYNRNSYVKIYDVVLETIINEVEENGRFIVKFGHTKLEKE